MTKPQDFRINPACRDLQRHAFNLWRQSLMVDSPNWRLMVQLQTDARQAAFQADTYANKLEIKRRPKKVLECLPRAITVDFQPLPE